MLVGGLVGGLLSGPVGGLLFGLAFGLIGRSAEGLGAGLAFGLYGWIFGGLLTILTGKPGLSSRQVIVIERLHWIWIRTWISAVSGLYFGMGYGLVYGLVFGLVGGLAFGGYTCLSHLALRIILHCHGSLPLRLVPFLDECADRIFLRKVGGGYIFVHRLLMEHFASLSESASPPTEKAP